MQVKRTLLFVLVDVPSWCLAAIAWPSMFKVCCTVHVLTYVLVMPSTWLLTGRRSLASQVLVLIQVLPQPW